jgi:hypothetical protein
LGVLFEALELFFILEIIKGFYVSRSVQMFLSWKKFWTVFLGKVNSALGIFETLKAVWLKIQVFWDLTLFLSVNGSQLFEAFF